MFKRKPKDDGMYGHVDFTCGSEGTEILVVLEKEREKEKESLEPTPPMDLILPPPGFVRLPDHPFENIFRGRFEAPEFPVHAMAVVNQWMKEKNMKSIYFSFKSKDNGARADFTVSDFK